MIKILNVDESTTDAVDIVCDFDRRGEKVFGTGLADMTTSLKKAIKSDKVKGFTAVIDEQPLGLVVYTQSDENGRINFLYAIPGEEDKKIYSELINHCINRLKELNVVRINCEAPILTNKEQVRKIFRELGFETIERVTMVVELPVELPSSRITKGYEIESWDDVYLGEVSHLIYEGYKGTIDQIVYPELKTIAGTKKMITALINGASGRFDKEISKISFFNSNICGTVLFTLVKEEGFIPETIVSKDHRGKGLGKALLVKTLEDAIDNNVNKVRLGVSKNNVPAVSLYRKIGFEEKKGITAYIWEKGKNVEHG